MTKPTKWLCAQRRLRSAWVLSYPLSASEDSDQTRRMPRLIWVFAGIRPVWSESSLGAQFCWFCHEAAHSCFFVRLLFLMKQNLTTTLFWFNLKWALSSEFVSSSIPSWQILTAHAQPFSWARDLAFCLKVPLDSLLVWASSEGSGETARMRRFAWTFTALMGDKYQIAWRGPNVPNLSEKSLSCMYYISWILLLSNSYRICINEYSGQHIKIVI